MPAGRLRTGSVAAVAVEEAAGRPSAGTATASSLPDAASLSRSALASVGLVVLVVAGLAVALGAAAGPSFLIYGDSRLPGVPAWLVGPLAGVAPAPGPTTFSLLVLAMMASYVAVLAGAEALRPRVALGVVLLLHAALLVAPPILSGDLFSYLVYARLDLVHGLDPYRHAADVAPGDPLYPWVGIKHIASPYGPLFTLGTWVLVPLGPAAGVWALKALAVGAALACAALTWSCARRLGRAPLGPTLFVALNPVALVYGVGGGHNDLFMAVLILGGVRLALGGRERAAAAAVVGAASVKATGGLVLPFLLLGARRRARALGAALAATATMSVVALAGFGLESMLGYLEVVLRQGGFVSLYSVWPLLVKASGLGTGVPTLLRVLLLAAFAAATLAAGWRAWHGEDWVSCAGWAVLALLVTTTWILPWYVVLLTPLAALGSSARLRIATHAFTVLVLITRLPVLLG